MHYFSDKFSKIVNHGVLRPDHRPQLPLTFDIGDLKLCGLAKM